MTREEAKALEQQPNETVTEFADRCRECGAKYGKLLKQQPCEDCVSREAVLDIVNNPLNIRLADIIQALPSVTPKEKTGHWIKRHYTKLNGIRFSMDVCNQCFEEFSYDHETGIGTYNYCPNCGAKMEEE